MKFNDLHSQQRGVLEGVLGASVVLTAGIGIGLYFLHQRHEAELDKLEKDTAMSCLDFAAEHYGRVLRSKKKAPPERKAESEISFEVSTEFQSESNVADRSRPCEKIDVEALSRRIDRLKQRHERLMHDIETRDTIFCAELEKISKRLFTEKNSCKEVESIQQ